MVQNLRCLCLEKLGGPSLFVSSFGKGKQAGISGVPVPGLGFSHPQQMPCVLMEEFPGEPLCASGIRCSQRGGVKGAVSPL